MNLLYFLIDTVSTLVYGTLIFLSFREFIPLRFQNKIIWAAEILCLGLLGNIIVYPEEITGTVGNLIGILPILILFHKGEWYRKITAGLIVYPVIMAVSFLFQDIGQQIWQYGFHQNMTEYSERALFIFMRIVKAPVWYLIYRYIKIWVPQAIQMLSRRMWSILSLISLTSFIGIIIIIYKCSYDDSYLAWPSCIATLITSMGCCYLCTYMAKIVRSDMELETIQYQRSYYQELENNQQTVRRMRHDMKNHLGVVETLLRDGKYEMAHKYLHDLDQEFTSHTRIYCEDPVINAVLNVKFQKAETEKIACQYQVDIKGQLPLEDIELCTLLANTLDNAIEASIKITDVRKRKISLKVRCMNGNISCEIMNAKNNQIIEKNGLFETDKSDRCSHGLGLRSVKQIVNKHNGEIKIEYTDDIFKVIIFI